MTIHAQPNLVLGLEQDTILSPRPIKGILQNMFMT